MRLLTALVSACLLLVASGCDSDPEPTTFAFEPKLSVIQEKVFAISCNASVCHASNAASGGLVLDVSSSESHAALVGVDAKDPGAVADGLERVVAGDPDNSFLIMKMTGGLDAKYGTVMPQGLTEGLDKERLDVVREWVRLGAPND